MRIALVTLFPEFFEAPLSVSVLGRAQQAGVFSVASVSPRTFATNTHRTVDDTPYGGGAGMVMRAPELGAAVEEARELAPGARVLLLSPQGARLDQAAAARLAAEPGLILVCGRYEGVDERFIERYVDEEVCLGDFVLSGGEPAALCLIDAVVRLLPGGLGNAASAVEESFSDARLEYPQFTRPPVFDELPVPAVLTSGDHARVAKWRQKVGLLRTLYRRPDLLARRPISKAERKLLGDDRLDVPAWLYLPRIRR